MKTTSGTSGRISEHSHGLGTVTHKMVTERAKELAAIDGRAGTVSEADWQQARRELSGEQDDKQPEEPVAGLRKWDEPPETSRQVPNRPAPDEQSVAERLTREGVDEAVHDQMLKASRNQTGE